MYLIQRHNALDPVFCVPLENRQFRYLISSLVLFIFTLSVINKKILMFLIVQNQQI